MDPYERLELSGVVTSRKCPVCGHHEVGLTTQNGDFYPLRPGVRVQIVTDPSADILTSEPSRPGNGEDPVDEAERLPPLIPWVPDPVQRDPLLRRKYGVLLRQDLDADEMTGALYQAAYMEKLQRLIEKEIHTPVPVILDRFFTAPHLGSGNPRQISHAMWQELEEIRLPVHQVGEWLADPISAFKMDQRQARRTSEPADPPPTPDTLKRELEELTLEEFLDLLQRPTGSV